MDVPRHLKSVLSRSIWVKEYDDGHMFTGTALIECIAMSVMINESVTIRCSIYGV